MGKALDWTCGMIIAITVYAACSLLFGGCGADPESFHAQACQRTPGDLYSYACQTKGYERCLTPAGDVKYADCEYMGIMCVTSCSEVD